MPYAATGCGKLSEIRRSTGVHIPVWYAAVVDPRAARWIAPT